MAIRVIGLDIAKSVFQVHGVDEARQAVLQRRLPRLHPARVNKTVATSFMSSRPSVMGPMRSSPPVIVTPPSSRFCPLSALTWCEFPANSEIREWPVQGLFPRLIYVARVCFEIKSRPVRAVGN
jgi:hypothetical protein